jgi:hypothetical protein
MLHFIIFIIYFFGMETKAFEGEKWRYVMAQNNGVMAAME